MLKLIIREKKLESCVFMKYDITIIRSNRKSLALEITEPGRLIVRAPKKLSNADVNKFIIDKQEWIQKHMINIQQRSETKDNLVNVTEQDLAELKYNAKKVFPLIVERYARIMGVDYGRITIRHQKTRWGSCSSRGNLNFNCLLMLAPRDVLEYVVVHELAHRKEMNHSLNFWKIVEDVKPDYKRAKRWLREEGIKLCVVHK